MPTTLIKNGRIVTAVDVYNADILIDGGTIVTIGKSIVAEADKVIDPRGDRSAYAYGVAVWRDIGVRHVRDWDDCGGAWGDHNHHRLCRAVQGAVVEAGGGCVARQGGWQDIDRLWVPSHLHRSAGRAV